MTLSWLALPLALGALGGFLTKRLPLELLAMGGCVAAVLQGWLSPEEALLGFANPATVTVAVMFVLSAAVVRTGALEPLERWLIQAGGSSLRQQLLALGLVVGPLSAVLSNTAVVAMFIPVVERWSHRLGLSPARLLMPLSFLTILAGVGTLLGSSTNLVASSLSLQLGYGSFGLLQFTPLALATYICGLAILLLVAPLALPSGPSQPRPQELEQDYGLGNYLSELLVTAASPLIGKSIDASLLQHSFDVRVLALIREGEHISLPLGNQQLRDNDVLVVKGEQQRLLALQAQQGLELLPELQVRLAVGEAPQQSELSIMEALVPAGSQLIGQSLRDSRFAQRFNASVLAIRRGGELLRDRLGQVQLRLGDALLLQSPTATIKALQISRELLLVDSTAMPLDRADRRPWALGLIAMVALLTLWRSDGLPIWGLLAVVGLAASQVLTAEEIYAAVRWDVVILLASLLPLAKVITHTGLDLALVRQLQQLNPQLLSPYALLVCLYLLTALVTEVLSNQAAITLMLPLGLGLCQGLEVSAIAAMAVMTFAASHSFLTPIGYQTNAMVYSLGGYSFGDFLRLGLPLTLALGLLTPAFALQLRL